MAIEIRLLCEGDADAWLNIRLEALETEPLAFGKSVAEHLATPSKKSRPDSSRPPGAVYAGVFDGAQLFGVLVAVATSNAAARNTYASLCVERYVRRNPGHTMLRLRQ